MLLIEVVPEEVGFIPVLREPIEVIELVVPTTARVDTLEPAAPIEPTGGPVEDPIAPDPEIPPRDDAIEPEEEPENRDKKLAVDVGAVITEG